MEISLEELKTIMGDLISEPRIADEKYKSAYVDGVLDFFSRLKSKEEKAIKNTRPIR